MYSSVYVLSFLKYNMVRNVGWEEEKWKRRGWERMAWGRPQIMFGIKKSLMLCLDVEIWA
jgi:hypothetical protein